MKSGVLAVAREVWSRVPERVRALPAIHAVGTSVRSWLGGEANVGAEASAANPSPSPRPVPQPEVGPIGGEPAIHVVRTLAELDVQMARLDAAAAISDDELRRVFLTFSMEFPLALPSDPDSDAYREAQMQLYKWLHGKAYTVANEGTPFDLPTVVRHPFPYSTQSPETVGNQLIAIGHVIRTLGMGAGKRVLEFGPGWGNTTVALARMGCKVTAVDIEAKFLALIEQRAWNKGLEIETIHGDFSLAQTLDRQFDAVLFFECFHHCAHHQSLIAALDRVVAPGGKVVFAAEPILDEFPLPWGLRLDGESLWAIRRHGWLELGFQETYFRGLLDRNGWTVDKVVCPETPWGVIFVAKRKPAG